MTKVDLLHVSSLGILHIDLKLLYIAPRGLVEGHRVTEAGKEVLRADLTKGQKP